MDKMSEEERKRILESPPVGTFALMSVVILHFLHYGVFLPRVMLFSTTLIRPVKLKQLIRPVCI